MQSVATDAFFSVGDYFENDTIVRTKNYVSSFDIEDMIQLIVKKLANQTTGLCN